MNVWEDKTQQLRLFHHEIIPDNLFYLFFTTYSYLLQYFAITVSIELAPTVVINQSLAHSSPQKNFRQVWWFINFNVGALIFVKFL